VLAAVAVVLGAIFILWFAVTRALPSELVGATPYMVTLLVLALASQRLRMPAADGRPYRRGEE
jgi:simple sugar transport system permease protein